MWFVLTPSPRASPLGPTRMAAKGCSPSRRFFRASSKVALNQRASVSEGSIGPMIAGLRSDFYTSLPERREVQKSSGLLALGRMAFYDGEPLIEAGVAI